MSAGARDRWLDKIDVGELWSIGRASESKLLAIGIVTVAQLRNLDTRIARKMLSVVGDQIILELRGVPCLALEHVPRSARVAVTRSFGSPVTGTGERRTKIVR